MSSSLVIAEYIEISHSFLQYNLIDDNHRSPVFPVSGKFFAWEHFGGNPRANGAKRRSGRKPGARVTNFVLAELKVVARDR